MRYPCLAAVAALSLWVPSMLFGQANAAGLAPNDVTVGQNLEAAATVVLKGPALGGELKITLTSSDPSRLLLANKATDAGSASIVVTLNSSFRETPSFFLQGLDKSGTVTYTASASGLSSGTGTVTLAPSGVVIAGEYGVGKTSFVTTTGAGQTKINVFSGVLDSSLNYVAPQPVAGGRAVNVKVTSSNTAAGTLASSALTIPGGSSNATTMFQPVTPGDVAVAVSVPPGFSAPAQYTSVTARVVMPGMAISDPVTIGKNHESTSVLSLGEAAPAGGLVVTVTSEDPSQLLLASGTGKPSKSITLTIPAGGTNSPMSLQALGGSATVNYTASAPGYRNRTASAILVPSGVVIAGPHSFPRSGGPAEPGFMVSLATTRGKPTPIHIYMVYLDPVTKRSADVTVQGLRPGVDLSIELKSSNPEVGTIDSPVLMKGGTGNASTAVTQFIALKAGITVLSVITPQGYTPSANATTLKVLVTE